MPKNSKLWNSTILASCLTTALTLPIARIPTAAGLALFHSVGTLGSKQACCRRCWWSERFHWDPDLVFFLLTRIRIAVKINSKNYVKFTFKNLNSKRLSLRFESKLTHKAKCNKNLKFNMCVDSLIEVRVCNIFHYV